MGMELGNSHHCGVLCTLGLVFLCFGVLLVTAMPFVFL